MYASEGENAPRRARTARPQAPSATPATPAASPAAGRLPRTDCVHRNRLAAARRTASGWKSPYCEDARFCGSMTASPVPHAARARTRAHAIHSPAPTAPTPITGMARRHAGPPSDRSRIIRITCHATAAIRKTPVYRVRPAAPSRRPAATLVAASRRSATRRSASRNANDTTMYGHSAMMRVPIWKPVGARASPRARRAGQGRSSARARRHASASPARARTRTTTLAATTPCRPTTCGTASRAGNRGGQSVTTSPPNR